MNQMNTREERIMITMENAMNQLKLMEVSHGEIMISSLKSPFLTGVGISVVSAALNNNNNYTWDEEQEIDKDR